MVEPRVPRVLEGNGLETNWELFLIFTLGTLTLSQCDFRIAVINDFLYPPFFSFADGNTLFVIIIQSLFFYWYVGEYGAWRSDFFKEISLQLKRNHTWTWCGDCHTNLDFEPDWIGLLDYFHWKRILICHVFWVQKEDNWILLPSSGLRQSLLLFPNMLCSSLWNNCTSLPCWCQAWSCELLGQ